MENREWVAAVTHPTDPEDPPPATALQAYTHSVRAVLESAATSLNERELDALFDNVRRIVA